MEKIFFSRNNYNKLFSIVKENISKKHNIDISTNEKFSKEIINIMKMVYSNRNNFNFPANMPPMKISQILSNKVISVSNSYFDDSLKSNTDSRNNFENRDMIRDNSVNKLSDRPSPSMNNIQNNVNVSQQYDKLMKLREFKQNIPQTPNFQSQFNVTNSDVNKKYEEITNNRQNEYENISQNTVNKQNFYPETINDKFNNSYNQNIPSSNLQRKTMNNFENNNQMNQMNQMNQEKQDNTPNTVKNNFNSNFEHVGKNKNPLESLFEDNTADLENMSEISKNDNLQLTNNILENNSNNNSNNNFSNNMSPNVNGNGEYSMTPDNVDMDSLFNSMDGNIDEELQNNLNTDKSTAKIQKVNNESNINFEIIKKKMDQQENENSKINNRIQKLIDVMESQNIDKFYKTILDIPTLIKQQEKLPLTIKTNNLIVSSRDRDFNNLEFNKYNFKIVFGANSGETVKKIITDDTISDSNKEKFSVKTTTFSSSSLKNPNIKTVLRNIISIKLKRVIIPRPRNDTFFPEPYFFVCVDEFNSNILSTKSFNKNIFCKIHFDKFVEFGDYNGTKERAYMYYKNDDDDFTVFYSSPLSKLDRISLQLVGSNGENLGDIFKDTDILDNCSLDNSDVVINDSFYYNSFKKDRIFNTTKKTYHRITNVDTTGQQKKITFDKPVSDGDTLINITNQIEYIFEVKMHEPDSTSEIRPSLV